MYPFYFLFPLLVTYYAARPFLGAGTTQRYISISNTYLTILAYLPFCYFPQHQAPIYYWLFEYSASYFLTDTLIILFHNRSQWIFLFHHLATLWIFFQDQYLPYLHLKMLAYFYVELSNAFLTAYELYRTKKVKTLLAIFYIPYRLCIVPYYGLKLLLTSIHIPYIWIPILGLIGMSIGYALKLNYKRPLNYLALLPLYLNIELLYHILPTHPHYLHYLPLFLPYLLYSSYRVVQKTLNDPTLT